jgi:signal transduction histidine kinase
MAKPEQLLRAVGNLLDSAVKFTPHSTPIELTVRPGRIDVRDAAEIEASFGRIDRGVDESKQMRELVSRGVREGLGQVPT